MCDSHASPVQGADLALEDAWVFYAHTKSGDDYAQTYVRLADASTIREFWNAFNNIPTVHIVKDQVSIGGKRVIGLSLFRRGCKPEWEDPRNALGGSYACRTIEPIFGWRDLCMAAIGETISCTGVRMVAKPMHNHVIVRFEVWTETVDNDALAAVASAAGAAPSDVRFTEHQARTAPGHQRPNRDRRRR